METNAILYALRDASNLLNEANSELFRPENDSVMLCACQSIKKAVKKILRTYLAENNVESSTESIEGLLNECRHLNPTFNSVQLSSFECRSHDHCDSYCLDENKVRSCFTQAKLLEEFVLERMNISMEEVYSDK